MRHVHVTKHAKKRIERGDQRGKRTELSTSEVVDLVQAPHAIKEGRMTAVYSEKDDEVLIIVTARQGRVIVTVHGTGRMDTRLADMVARARAGASFQYSEPTPISGYSELDASRITLGVSKVKKGIMRTNDLVDIGHVFETRKDVWGSLETEHLHQLIVSATDEAIDAEMLSKTQLKKLRCFINDDRNFYFASIPVWVSYTLMGRTYPSEI